MTTSSRSHRAVPHEAGAPRITVIGSTGTDTIDVSALRAGLDLDLAAGTRSDLPGAPGGLEIASGARIENARGGHGADTIRGNFLDNALEGGAGDDTLDGGAGFDTLIGGPGDDTLLPGADGGRLAGGPGQDIAIFDIVDDIPSIAFSPDGTIVTAGAGGRVTLDGVETIVFEFPDGAGERFNAALFDDVGQVAPDDLRTVTEMYVAYFDRAPDALGLAYWASRLHEGLSLDAIAELFFEQTEARALFSDPLDTAALVDAAYRNVLERDPDAPGRAFWIDALETGDVSKGSFMRALIDGAKTNPDSAADARTLEHKGAIGLAYAGALGFNDPGRGAEVMDLYDRARPDQSLWDVAQWLEAADATLAEAGRTPFVGVAVDPLDLV